MKRLFTAAAFLLILNTAMAQTKIGFRGGWIYSTAKVIEDSVKQQVQYLPGYTVGLFFKFPFERALHFSPSISFSHRGYSYTHTLRPIKKTEFQGYYIDVIPSATVDFHTTRNSALILGFCPMFSIGLSAKEKNTFPNDSVSVTKAQLNFYNYSQVDIGLTGSIGYRFGKRVLLEGSYTFGLANVENDETQVRNIQNRMFMVTLGYIFRDK